MQGKPYEEDQADAGTLAAEPGTLVISLEGSLDAETAPKLEERLNNELGNADVLILDMRSVEYVSSAGLRVILQAQKTMSAKGGMKVIHVNDFIMELFESVGFDEILDIEQ